MKIIPILCGKLSLKAKRDKEHRITSINVFIDLTEGKKLGSKHGCSGGYFQQLNMFDREILKISVGGETYQVKKSNPGSKENYVYIVLESS